MTVRAVGVERVVVGAVAGDMVGDMPVGIEGGNIEVDTVVDKVGCMPGDMRVHTVGDILACYSRVLHLHP